MIQLINLMVLMVGMYIITRMMFFLFRKDTNSYKFGIVMNKLLAVCTIIIVSFCVTFSILSLADTFEAEAIFTSQTAPVEKEIKPKLTEKKIEQIEPPYIIITKAADLHRSDTNTKREIGDIPVGTKLKILDDYVWQSSSIDLKLFFYQVEYKKVYGWVLANNCKLITQ